MLLVSLFIASSAFASWNPVFSSRYEELTVGETRTIHLSAVWSGFTSLTPFEGWICVSNKEDVAHVEGGVRNTVRPGKVRITALAPGVAWVRIRSVGELVPGPSRFVQIVVHPKPVSVSVTPSASISRFGQPVTLTAITEGSPHTLLWYLGRVGDVSLPLAVSGREVTVIPSKPGVAYYWVSAIGTEGTSAAEIAIEVKAAPRQRGVRH